MTEVQSHMASTGHRPPMYRRIPPSTLNAGALLKIDDYEVLIRYFFTFYYYFQTSIILNNVI